MKPSKVFVSQDGKFFVDLDKSFAYNSGETFEGKPFIEVNGYRHYYDYRKDSIFHQNLKSAIRNRDRDFERLKTMVNDLK